MIREARDELSALRFLLDRYGFTITQHEEPVILTDGTTSPVSLRVSKPEVLAKVLAGVLERDKRRREREFKTLLDRSSIGTHAWIDCPIHGHTARDPDTRLCVRCPQ